jgi:hypothetical protein
MSLEMSSSPPPRARKENWSHQGKKKKNKKKEEKEEEPKNRRKIKKRFAAAALIWGMYLIWPSGLPWMSTAVMSVNFVSLSQQPPQVPALHPSS